MAVEIDAFLTAYGPSFICLSCLSAVTERDPADVQRALTILLAGGRAERRTAECLNCGARTVAVRRIYTSSAI